MCQKSIRWAAEQKLQLFSPVERRAVMVAIRGPVEWMQLKAGM